MVAWLSLASGVVALSPTWSYFYNGLANDVDISRVIIRGSDGNLYVAGASRSRPGDPSSYDLVVLSLTPNGSVRWVYRYNGPADLEDGAYDMIEGPDGNLYGTGITTVDGIDYDLMVFSLTKSGQLRWLYTYDGTAHGHDVGDAIVADDAGNLYVAGMSSRIGLRDNYDWVVLSFTANGTLRWLDRYNGPGDYHDRAYDITYGSDGNLYVAGYRVTSGNFADFMVAKYTTGGSRLWIRTQNPSGYHDMAYTVTFGADGNVYAAGRLEVATGWEFAVVSYDPSGNLRWVYTNPNTYGEAYALTYGQTGLYVAGLTQNSRFTVVSLNTTDGSEAWVYQYVPANNEYGRATGILQNTDGSLYAYGGVRFTNDNASRPTVVKLTRTGTPVYEESFPYFLIYTNKPKEYIDLANLDYPTFYLTAGVSGNGTTQDISFGIEEWEQYGHVQTFDATNESTDHNIWVARFDEISVTLLWPNQPGIVLEEGDTTYVRFDGIAGQGIDYVESRFSPDGGLTWPYYIGSKSYPLNPTIADDDSIRWIVDVPATDSGRVKAVLYDTQNDSVFDISAYDIQVKLARPGNLQAQTASPWTSVTLTWQDNSNYNTGYEIRRIDEVQDTVDYTISDPNAASFTDNHVEPFHTYLYQIRSTDGAHTSDWVDIYVFNTPHWALEHPVRWVRTVWAGDWLYVFYASPENGYATNAQIYYRYSRDGGFHFSDEVSLETPVGIFPYKFEVAGERYGHRVGVLYRLTDQHGGDWNFFVRVVEGSTVGPEIPLPTLNQGGFGDGGLFWKPGTDTLLVGLVKAQGNYENEQPFWAVHAVDGTVIPYGGLRFFPDPVGEVGVQDRIFSTVYGPAWMLTFPEGWQSPPSDHLRMESYPLQGGQVYGATGILYDLGVSQSLVAFREGQSLRIFYYFVNEQGILDWTDPPVVYTYASADTCPVDLEPARRGLEEYLLVQEGPHLRLLRRGVLGDPTAWSPLQRMNLLPSRGISDLDLALPILSTPGNTMVKIAVAYALEEEPLVVFKRRTFRPLHAVVADPTRLDLPGDGQVRLFRTPDQTYAVWYQGGSLWYAWADDKAETWTSPHRLCSGWAPTLVATEDTGFRVLFWRGTPGQDTLMSLEYHPREGFSAPEVLWVSEPGVVHGPVAASASEGALTLGVSQLAGSLRDSLFVVTSEVFLVLTLDPAGHLLRVDTLAVEVKSAPDTLTPWGARMSLRAPSLVSYADYVAVLSLTPDSSAVSLYEFLHDHWHTRTVASGDPPYRTPHVALEGKTVYLFWSQGTPGEIFYRYLYAGDTSFISKPMNLSNTPDAHSTSPWYAGQRVFWSEEGKDGLDIVHLSLALSAQPEVLDPQPWGDALASQAVVYRVGGEYYETTVYVATWLEEEHTTHQTALLSATYATGPIPEQVITLGDTLPNPSTVSRRGFEVYSDQKGKSADVGSALEYKIKDLDPGRDYRFGLYIYHEKDTTVRERFYADGQELKVSEAEPGTITYVEIEIPSEMYVVDSMVELRVEKVSGPTAVLNEIYVFGEDRSQGGPMAGETVGSGLPRAFDLRVAGAMPMRHRGDLVLAVPRRAKVQVEVYDIAGRRVATLVQGVLEAGYHRVAFPGASVLPAGMYLVHLRAPGVRKTVRVVWLP